MKKLLHIFFCFAVLLFLWDTTGFAAPNESTADKSSSIHKAAAPTAYPAHRPGLPGTPFQAEVTGHYAGPVQAASPEDTQDHSNKHSRRGQTLRQDCRYLFSFNAPAPGIRIKKLIFPFHTYL